MSSYAVCPANQETPKGGMQSAYTPGQPLQTVRTGSLPQQTAPMAAGRAGDWV